MLPHVPSGAPANPAVQFRNIINAAVKQLSADVIMKRAKKDHNKDTHVTVTDHATAARIGERCLLYVDKDKMCYHNGEMPMVFNLFNGLEKPTTVGEWRSRYKPVGMITAADDNSKSRPAGNAATIYGRGSMAVVASKKINVFDSLLIDPSGLVKFKEFTTETAIEDDAKWKLARSGWNRLTPRVRPLVYADLQPPERMLEKIMLSTFEDGGVSDVKLYVVNELEKQTKASRKSSTNGDRKDQSKEYFDALRKIDIGGGNTAAMLNNRQRIALAKLYEFAYDYCFLTAFTGDKNSIKQVYELCAKLEMIEDKTIPFEPREKADFMNYVSMKLIMPYIEEGDMGKVDLKGDQLKQFIEISHTASCSSTLADAFNRMTILDNVIGVAVQPMDADQGTVIATVLGRSKIPY